MIHMLDLTENKIRSIDSEAFAGLEGLLYLNISRSHLTAIDDPRTD
jgi:Leucine-rich repeat (LRR) protein